MSNSGDRSDDGSASMMDFGDNVDVETFSQILEMDENEDDRDFSKPLVFNFIEQAEETFVSMDEALAERDLQALYHKGHFLKGSSATLGFKKIRDNCQLIQQWGQKVRPDGNEEPSDDVCLERCREALAAAKRDLQELKPLLDTFYKGSGDDT